MSRISQVVAVQEAMKTIGTSLDATLSTTAQSLTQLSATAAQLAGAKRVTISAAAACHFAFDGSTPTTTVGHVIAAAGTVIVEGNAQINALKIVADAATPKAFITFEG